jgi:phosphoglycolate phosphatase-like HAD superfamily hydrolase
VQEITGLRYNPFSRAKAWSAPTPTSTTCSGPGACLKPSCSTSTARWRTPRPTSAAPSTNLRREQGLAPLPLEQLRPHVSSGRTRLIGAGLGITPADTRYPALQQRFLAIYQDALCVGTRLFAGMAEHLGELEQRGIPWGIVTNKSQRFAIPLIEATRLRQRSVCIVCGDSARAPSPMATRCNWPVP